MKLPDIGEEVIRQLDQEDDAGIWRDREVYQRRISALWEAERCDIIEKLIRRQQGSGTTGADRRRAK